MITPNTGMMYMSPVLLTDAELEHAINRMNEDIRDGELCGITTLEAHAWLAVAYGVQRDRVEHQVLTDDSFEPVYPGWLIAILVCAVLSVGGFAFGWLEVGASSAMLAVVCWSVWILRNDSRGQVTR